MLLEDRYQLEEPLGRGAMGEVWLATDLQTNQPVALKLLALSREFSPEDLADVHERFMREARAARQLRHPDILQVLETGDAGADAWIVMEYVQGHDLSHFSRPGHLLPAVEAVKIPLRSRRIASGSGALVRMIMSKPRAARRNMPSSCIGPKRLRSSMMRKREVCQFIRLL